jgi:hypothetical protein
MGAEAAEGHDHWQGGADRSTFPVLKHLDDFSLLALQVKSRAPMLWMGEYNHIAAHLDLITCLHEPISLAN